MDDQERLDSILELGRENRRLAKHSRLLNMTITSLMVAHLRNGNIELCIELLTEMHEFYKKQIADD